MSDEPQDNAIEEFESLRQRLQALAERLQLDDMVIAHDGPVSLSTQATGLRRMHSFIYGTRCVKDERIIEISGRSSTDESGEFRWVFTEFYCPLQVVVGEGSLTVPAGPISFVATPVSNAAVFLTTAIRPSSDDLNVSVFSWGNDGTRVPRVQFSWFFRASSFLRPIIL